VQGEAAFYLGDKIPFLRKAGFGRFIADFTGGPVKKHEYKAVMQAVQHNAVSPLETSTRFNWKDGFYEVKT
jgi:hypothetical protein